jgi:hypothetical protein
MRPRPNLNGLAIERTETTIYVSRCPRKPGDRPDPVSAHSAKRTPSWNLRGTRSRSLSRRHYGTDTTWTVHRPEDNPYAIALTREIP